MPFMTVKGDMAKFLIVALLIGVSLQGCADTNVSLPPQGVETPALEHTPTPQIADISDASLTRLDVLEQIGVSDRASGILVAYEDKYELWSAEHCTKYIVFVFDGDCLHFRDEYRFYTSEEDYHAAKTDAVSTDEICNDTLYLRKTTYAADTDLRAEYRGLNYEQLEAALKDDYVTILQAVEPNYKDIPVFSFSNISQIEFLFASGAGAWGTWLTIDDDGTFSGNYHDSEMGSAGADYPNGICYLCRFSGKFSEPVKVNDYTYSVKLEQLEMEDTPGTEKIEDGIKYIYSQPYGLEGAENFLFYLPGTPVEDLPEGFLGWSGNAGYVGTELPSYGFYNANQEQGFFGCEFEE